MNPESILPQHSSDFWIKRWILGLALSSGTAVWGLVSIVQRHSYALAGGNRQIEFIEVSGFEAIVTGIGYLGLALALFSYAYAPYSKRFSHFSEYGFVIGLLVALVGIGFCAGAMLTRWLI